MPGEGVGKGEGGGGDKGGGGVASDRSVWRVRGGMLHTVTALRSRIADRYFRSIL